MAGMLPGVEAARRRRFHNSNLNHGSQIVPPISSGHGGSFSTRRSSLCLYAVNSYELHSKKSFTGSSLSNHQQGLCDDESRLCAAAREAKKRLDERLQSQRRSEIKRMGSRTTPSSQQRSSGSFSGVPQLDHLPKAQVMPKPKKMNWLKLISWKSSEQEECAVCLEQLRAGRGETVMQLLCGHRFHTKCLVPWVEGKANAHCPCCRMEIPC